MFSLQLLVSAVPATLEAPHAPCVIPGTWSHADDPPYTIIALPTIEFKNRLPTPRHTYSPRHLPIPLSCIKWSSKQLEHCQHHTLRERRSHCARPVQPTCHHHTPNRNCCWRRQWCWCWVHSDCVIFFFLQLSLYKVCFFLYIYSQVNF